MKLFREHEVEVMLDELSKFITDLHQGKPRTKPMAPQGIEITEEEIERLIRGSIWHFMDEGDVVQRGERSAARAIMSKLNEP